MKHIFFALALLCIFTTSRANKYDTMQKTALRINAGNGSAEDYNLIAELSKPEEFSKFLSQSNDRQTIESLVEKADQYGKNYYFFSTMNGLCALTLGLIACQEHPTEKERRPENLIIFGCISAAGVVSAGQLAWNGFQLRRQNALVKKYLEALDS